MNKSLGIVFMGTPDFAVPSLQALNASRHRILQVVSRPDRPRGRGRKLRPPPVKTCAADLGLTVCQPPSLKNSDVVADLARMEPEVFVVVAYGEILNRRLLEVPRIGTLNLHASLLPKYRGPAPIQWAIIRGEKETGVTTMMMNEGLDTGDILLQSSEPIRPQDTAEDLHVRLARRGADLLVQTLDAMADGTLQPVPQDDSQASFAPILQKEDGAIDWQKPAREIVDLIRGVTPWPGAYCFLQGKRLKIFGAEAVAEQSPAAPGTVVAGFADALHVAAGRGIVRILEIQSQSGKRMNIADFLRGTPIPAGTILSA
jgi:methionyl-tRNA formyltransferase